MQNKRLLIAGTRSGVGKTTVSLGLMAALTKRKYDVQPFKVGPDYIDPGFHTIVTNNNSYNLDSYFLGENGVKELFLKNTVDSDIAIIEGVMGLFDGKGKKGTSSSAEIAKTLKTPVILVIDGKKMAQSGAALAYGYKNYDSDLDVKGVILNNIASERHYMLLKESIESKPVNLKVLGYLPRQEELELPERHLGLVPIQESEDLKDYISKLVTLMEKYIDLDEIIKIADNTLEINIEDKKLYNHRKKYDIDLGVAYDQAFNFYYQYNLDLLEKMGANIIYFSPVKDKKLPEVDGIYIGGGFPESFLEQLAKNESMKKDIKEKVKDGIPVYAECGGLMYLSESIVDQQNNLYKMLALIPGQVIMENSLQEMGYREVEVIKSNVILAKGEKAKGHVFHYSKLNKISKKVKKCYRINQNKLEGYSTDSNILASYLHLHFGSNTKIVRNFLHKAQLFKEKEITREVISYLEIFYKNGGIPEVEQIQDLVEKVLIEKGHAEVAKAYILYREQHKKIRDTKNLFDDAINKMDEYLSRSNWKVNENSNMGYSLQGLNNFISSEITSEYWLQEIYPKEIREKHKNGDFHIHDLGNLSVYCCGWDLQDLLMKGFRGVKSKVESKAPKHFKAALGQIVNFFYTLQGEAAGAQAFSNFDTYLAPFIRYDNLSYKEVKQAVQEFMFNINVPTRVGFQTPFTNITMDLEVPKFMKDDPVIIGGEFQGESYGEFQKEMDLLNKAFAEVMISGDAKGRMFSFPIPTYNITEDFEWDNSDLDPVWEMTAKYGIPYFCLNETTNVITNNGIKQLKNIDINKDKVLGDDGNFCNIKKIFNSNHKEYIKINTEKDQIIECSLNHSFPTRNGLKKAINLSMSDELREYNKEIIFENGFRLNYKNYKYFNVYNKSDEKIFFENINKENIDGFYYLKVCDREKKTVDEFNYISNRFQTTLKDIKIPEKLDEDIFELIGQLLGDGYLPKTKNTIRLTSNDHEIIDFFTKTIEEKFKLNTYITKAGVSKTCLDVNVNSKMLKEYLKHVGLKFGRGDEKEIPQIIYERNDKEIGALLRGLFDTDGSISLNKSNNPIIILTLKNRKLLQQVLELLMFLGIAAYYKSSRKKYGEIRIHGEKNIKLFKDKIGFSIKRKSERLIIKDSNKPNLGDEIVTKKQALKKFGNDHRQRKKKEVFRIKRNAEGIYLFVDNIIEQNNYRKIKSLKRIKNKLKTVDIKVDSENHLFTLENNIVVHNSNFVNSDMDPEDARSMCLHPEETILIKEDNKISKYSMEELFKKYKDKKIDDEWYYVSSKIKALSLNPETGKVEWVDISKLLEIKDDRLITITAKDGKTMKVSADHMVAVYSEKGITTKKASQINKDDFLLVLQDGSDILNNENIEVANDLAWFMGLFMADGNYLYDSRYDKKIFRGVQITFNKQDKDLINKTKDFINKHLNYDMKFILDPRYDNSLRGYIYDSNFAKNLNHKFSLKKYHKLPEWIWSSSTDTITSFIKGFFAGDGYELGKEIHINDQSLAIELNFLFQLVGISTTLNFKKNLQVIRIQHVLGRGANNKIIKDKLHNLIPQYLLDPKFIKDKNGNILYQSYGCKMVGLSTIDRWKISNKKIEFLRNADFAVTEVKEIKREKLNYQQSFYDIELKKNHYFVHSDGNITHNCCRLRLDNRQLRKRGGGLFGANPLTGSIGVVTINLPRIGYLAKSKEDYLNRVFELMDLAKESLEIKRKVLEDLTEKNLYPYSKFYLEGVKKRFDQYWKNHFNTIGINGMNESLLNFMGKSIATDEGNEFAVEVMEVMKERMIEYQEETDNLYNLEATPAESTAYRLAKLDKEQLGDDIICANQKRYEDENADPYYTNSSQLPVDYTGDIFEALNLQDELQSEYTGGTVFHGFLGEKMPDIESTKLLVKRIAENFKLPYYTISPTFSICPVHGYLPGEHEYCPKCEAEAAREDN